MNTENILKLADIIEKQEHAAETVATSGFNMTVYWHPCGTPSCIAGFASEQSGHTKDDERTFINASNWLDIDSAIADKLFAPSGFFLPDITPKMAAWTLRNLAETGKVEWRHYEV